MLTMLWLAPLRVRQGGTGPLLINIANILFLSRRGGRGPARDVVALQDQIQSLSPDQISVGVDTVPVVLTTLVKAHVDVDERHQALVCLVKHELPVAKDVDRRCSRPLAVVGALRVRLRVWNVVILVWGGRRRWTPVQRRWSVGRLRLRWPVGRARRMHVAHPSTHLLVPGEWPVSLLVLLQAVLGEVEEGGWW
jgi:hypothetical protein